MGGLSQAYCNRERLGWEREIEKRLLVEAELNFDGYLPGGRPSIQSRGLIFPFSDGIDCCVAKEYRSTFGFGFNDFPGRVDLGGNYHVTLDIRLLGHRRIYGRRGFDELGLTYGPCGRS